MPARRAFACAGICRRVSSVRLKAPIDPSRVADIAARLLDLGVFEVADQRHDRRGHAR